MESICWSCARAYAKQDPEGCGFHRQEHEEVWDEAERAIRSKPTACTEEKYEVIRVTKCKQYEIQDRREIRPKDLSISTLMKHKYREGIA